MNRGGIFGVQGRCTIREGSEVLLRLQQLAPYYVSILSLESVVNCSLSHAGRHGNCFSLINSTILRRNMHVTLIYPYYYLALPILHRHPLLENHLLRQEYGVRQTAIDVGHPHK
jgi:hypothetical protein